MPEPSGLADDNSGTVRRPRPTPRLSLLMLPRNERHCYENIEHGWIDKRPVLLDMATSTNPRSASRSGGVFSLREQQHTRQQCGSNIPVPRRVVTTPIATLLNKPGQKSSTVVTTTENFVSTTSHYSSKNSEVSRGVDNSRHKVTASVSHIPIQASRVTFSARSRLSSKVTTSLENMAPRKTSGLTVRNRNVRHSSGESLDVVSHCTSECGWSMDSLAVDFDDDDSLRKAEYRKSVSIPPDLVSSMTCKFNALIQKDQVNHLEVTCAHKTDIIPVKCSVASGVVVSSHQSDFRSCASSPNMHHPKGQCHIGQRLLSCDRGYVSATDGNESSDAESLDSRKERTEALAKQTRPNDCRSQEVDGRGERLSLVKQAIRNYEVALLKSSTSSPELLRKPSLPRHSPGSRQSQTLPTTVASRLPTSLTALNSVSTLPLNMPSLRRSSFRLARNDNNSFAARESTSGRQSWTASGRSRGDLGTGKIVASNFAPVPAQPVDEYDGQTETAKKTLDGDNDDTKAASSNQEVFCAKSDFVTGFSAEADGSSVYSTSSNMGATSRGKMLFCKRALSPAQQQHSNTQATFSGTMNEDRTSSLERCVMASLDLLAEIDSHPSLSRCRSDLLSTSPLSTVDTQDVAAPNASFLWKQSTQSQVSIGKHKSLPDLPELRLRSFAKATNRSNDSSSPEPLYEELANCTSTLSFPSSRGDVPLPLPEENGHDSASSSPESREAGVRADSKRDDDGDYSDGSWMDDDDDDSDHGSSTATANSSKPISSNKAKVWTKRSSSSSSSTLVRRSWSQSLRDLATAQANEGMAQEDLESAGWEDLVADERCDDSTPSVSDNSKKTVVLISPDTDSDKSPSSAVAVEKQSSNKTARTKKVKRNWSWSKADFRLDLSSKLGRITNAGPKKQQQQQVIDNNADALVVEISPTKKQWPFKTKFATKKSGRQSSPKGSPTKENAQFYVPSYNDDGSLAVSPCCEKPPAIEVDGKDEQTGVTGSLSSTARTSCRSSRRSSIAGSVITRPKTAPPAPPLLPARKCSCVSAKEVSDVLAFVASKGLQSTQTELISTNDDVTVDDVGSQRSEEGSRQSVDAMLPPPIFAVRVSSSSSIDDDLKSTSSLKVQRLELRPNFTPETSAALKLSPFEDEPLYQFYNMAACLRSARENQVEELDDGDSCYESIYQMLDDDDDYDGGAEEGRRTKTSAMDLVRTTDGGMRTLWCEVPEVKSSGILASMSMSQRKLQEVMFEVITSEASYLKSLNVLVECFVHCPQLSDDYSIDCVLSKRERHVLFSDVIPVKETSEKLLADLEKRWQESIVISDICDILQDHATRNFDVYVKYCSNQLYQDRCLKKLKEDNPQFVEVLRRLEASPICQSLSMYSFLMLPMQRITRLPLLVDAIFNKLEYGTKQYETCKQALATLNKIVHECNEGAHRMERMEEMLIISRQLDFRECRCLALISASRWLVKKGELTRLVFGDSSSKLSFGRRCAKQSVYLFLFTDLLIVTKKKSDDCYNVVDYCPRNLVQATEIENPEQLPGRSHDAHRNIFQLSMLQNHDNKTVEMFFSCPKESDVTRWVEAVTPRKSENPDERIYEEWDCPQVQAIHAYTAQQPDELSLEESDVVNVFRKMVDGWYQGERIRDGVQGWFPSNYTVEIVSSHIRARNLRQRYRLLALSHSYVENQRKKELGNRGR